MQRKHKKLSHKAKSKGIEAVVSVMEPCLAKITLVNAPPEKAFYLRDGRTLNNLLELVDALENMGDDVFAFHVNESKNDFANWISDALGEGELGETLVGNKSRERHQIAILKHLVEDALPK